MKIIKEKVKGFPKEQRNKIVKVFQELHHLQNEAEFKEKSDLFLDYMYRENESFHNYLLKEWFNHKYVEKWSRCYFPMLQANVNVTNNHIESLHKILKYHLSNRLKMRIDELIKFLFTTVSNYY